MIYWDDVKRQANIDKHGLDFADLDEYFFLSAAIFPAKSGRYKFVNELDGRVVVTVIASPLGSEAISVVSMRPASRRERQEREHQIQQ